jgi:hypothetical protein
MGQLPGQSMVAPAAVAATRQRVTVTGLVLSLPLHMWTWL